jgi:excinuclease ABC subunit C
MLPSFIDKELLPHKPGIYIFRDKAGEILYVGKAIDLYHRVASYFNNKDQTPKTHHLVQEIRSVETTIVESELEALILEASLIKKHLPPFNIRLTDDKDYIYIKITKADFPAVVTARSKDLSDARKYFGPFPSSRIVKETLKSLRRLFPWCANPPKGGESEDQNTRRSESLSHQTGPATARFRPCFYYHINQCPGPCVGKIGKEEYNKNLNRLCLLLEGKKAQLLEELHKEMLEDAATLQFEKASRIRRIISGLDYLTQPNRTKYYLENPNFLEDQNMQALIELQKILNLSTIPERIECYDISNIQGEHATGSMVVLTHGEIDKSEYRRFKIKITGKPNDVAMHQEMMRRRLGHDEWPLPDLFLIDGGRGQVRAVQTELLSKGLNIPVFGIAKRLEWLYPPDGEIIKIPRSKLSIRMLQKIRDEAHRFAITYHRKLRSRASGYEAR